MGDSARTRSRAGHQPEFGLPTPRRRELGGPAMCTPRQPRVAPRLAGRPLVPALRLQGSNCPNQRRRSRSVMPAGWALKEAEPRGAAVSCLRVIWTLRLFDNVHSKLQRGGRFLHQTSWQHRDKNSSASALHVDSGARSHSRVHFRGTSATRLQAWSCHFLVLQGGLLEGGDLL